MAISPCRNCGRMVSWEDVVCPHCSVRYPVDHLSERADEPPSDAPPVFGLLVMCLLFVLACLGGLLLISWIDALFAGVA